MISKHVGNKVFLTFLATVGKHRETKPRNLQLKSSRKSSRIGHRSRDIRHITHHHNNCKRYPTICQHFLRNIHPLFFHNDLNFKVLIDIKGSSYNIFNSFPLAKQIFTGALWESNMGTPVSSVLFLLVDHGHCSC